MAAKVGNLPLTSTLVPFCPAAPFSPLILVRTHGFQTPLSQDEVIIQVGSVI